jgi:hypothetical protein
LKNTDQEYVNWIWADTARLFLQAVAIYGVLLVAFWVLV